ncbi:hypothetical protein BDZ97DRAFT_1764564 [Flammula alnicola]|nr:hypothetical protein BDZ97DRAFT_1764564 [Flammula alnicola]
MILEYRGPPYYLGIRVRQWRASVPTNSTIARTWYVISGSKIVGARVNLTTIVTTQPAYCPSNLELRLAQCTLSDAENGPHTVWVCNVGPTTHPALEINDIRRKTVARATVAMNAVERLQVMFIIDLSVLPMMYINAWTIVLSRRLHMHGHFLTTSNFRARWKI